VFDVTSNVQAGSVPALELVTVGQRRGLPHGPDGTRRYVTSVDPRSRTVVVGSAAQVARHRIELLGATLTWTDRALPDGTPAVAQTSAHGRPVPCIFEADGDVPAVRFQGPVRPVAPGQTIALYDEGEPDRVLGAGVAA
jgi:tRNA-specific 2-thiouridylase